MNPISVGGRGVRARRALLVASSALCCGLSVSAWAQTTPDSLVRSTIDPNSVDLATGTLQIKAPNVALGSGNSALADAMRWKGSLNWQPSFRIVFTKTVSTATVSLPDRSVTFTLSGSTYAADQQDGSTLVQSGTDYIYTSSDGTKITFDGSVNTVGQNAKLIQYPSGRSITLTYDTITVRILNSTTLCTRVTSATDSNGYKITYQYANQTGICPILQRVASTTTVNTVTGVAGPSTAYSYALANSLASPTTTFTDPAGRVSSYRMGTTSPTLQYIYGLTRPGSASEDVTITYDSSKRVASIATAAGTTTYGYVDSGTTRTTTVTDPLGHVTTYVFDMSIFRPTSITDADGKVWTKQYDTAGRLYIDTAPEGNHTQYAYDSRGNVTTIYGIPKSIPGYSNKVTVRNFDPVCTNIAKCNKPNWIRDPNLDQTDYSYDLTTGNILTIQAPSATTSGPRPTTTFSYTTVNGAQLLSGTSTCLTSATCVGTANESKSTIGYNSNGLPTTITNQAGDGSIIATTTLGYDNVGNVTSVDGPLPGSSDTIYYRYDADREVIGVVAPDPDGSGPLVPKAQRNTYDQKGRVTLAEVGTVTDPSDAAWNAFSSLQQVATTYDGIDRPLTRTVTAGGTTFSVMQNSYDHQRLDCSAVRMNSGAWGSLPASACTLQTAGAAGADRITKFAYDNADRPTKRTSAYGTTDASDDSTIAYTNNGLQQTATDANGNVTTYAYDGFDRPLTTTYPGGSYEQFSYDQDDNLLTRRLRDGTSISYAYDMLNRVTTKTLPSGELAVSYGYDLLGHMTAATRSDGNNISAAYDALGRQTSATTTIGGTVGSQYDAAGNRTRLTWSDGFFMAYGYDTTSKMTLITENGTVNLVSFGYDNLGRRISLSRANGVTTTYGYDGASNLSSLALAYPTSSNNLTLGFSYNPAGQTTSATRSNDNYAWTGAVDVDRAYTVNALNQYTNAGGTSFGYDARGNLTASGTVPFGYSSENLLVSSSGTSLTYDPVGRLLQTVLSATTRFGYDGSNLITEYNSSNALQKRYVFGPGADEALVEYDASGNRTWLVADERHSIIARTDGSGNPTTINRYDEFGIPLGTNAGRHQFTGQAWIPEIGMYYFKARIYSPTLGRFMQTDPSGYSDGLNWYNYAHSDPINGSDPSGKDVYCSDGSIVGVGDDISEGMNTCGGDGQIAEITATATAPDGGQSNNLPSNNFDFTPTLGPDPTFGGVFRDPGFGSPIIQAPKMPGSCRNGGAPFSSGGYVEAGAEIGDGGHGAALQGQVSLMSFTNGDGVTYLTTGGFAGGRSSGFVAGFSAGVGFGGVVSNARNAEDLIGDAQAYNLNVGPVALSLSLGDNGIFSFSAGPSAGFSLDASSYKTHTSILTRTGCP